MLLITTATVFCKLIMHRAVNGRRSSISYGHRCTP